MLGPFIHVVILRQDFVDKAAPNLAQAVVCRCQLGREGLGLGGVGRGESLERGSRAEVVWGDDVEVVRVGRDLTREGSVVEAAFDGRYRCHELVVVGDVDEGGVEGALDRLDETFKETSRMGASCRIKLPGNLLIFFLAAVLA